MKQEKGSFIITGPVVALSFNDATLTPDTVMFWVDGSDNFHGDDDGTNPGCVYNGTLLKNDKSIHLQSGSTVIASGKVDYFDEGEMWLDFSTVPSYVVVVHFKVKQF